MSQRIASFKLIQSYSPESRFPGKIAGKNQKLGGSFAMATKTKRLSSRLSRDLAPGITVSS